VENKINKGKNLKSFKILQISKLYYPWIGGVERNLQVFAESIKDKTNIKILCCEVKGKTKLEKINDIEVLKSLSFGLFLSIPISPLFPFHYKKLTKESDLIHYHSLFPLGEVMEILLNPGKRKVVTLHYERLTRNYLMNLYKPLLRSFFKRMDLIIVPSRSFLNSKLLSGFEGKTEIIPFGIDMKKFELTQEVREIRDKIKKEYGFPILLFVGNLLPYKGLYYLIKAMREINGNLLIIGDGPQRKELVELTQKYGLIKKVHFLGRKSFEELIYFYHACDVFVLPSLYESFGNVQLEAMACGKPVVNTNIPTGVPEVSIHEQTGLTVPPEDSSALSQAINRLIENHEERIRYGEKARERVKNFFSIESVSEKILSLYEKLLL
jgi:rhamnosyl/mannosyltransferase